MARGVFFALIVLFGVCGDNKNEDCDFSKYSTAQESHFVERNVIKRVLPRYPEEAKRLAISGRVVIRILVNEKGQVEKTCPVYSGGSSREQTLVQAAEEAAKKWTFRPNFGWPKIPRLSKCKYRDAVLEFDFHPAGDKAELQEDTD